MENLEKYSSSETIRKEFHELMMSKEKKPKIELQTENPDQIKVLLAKPFAIIKEYTKLFFKKTYGFFPTHSEGNCKECSDKLLQILKGDLIWGWFTTDRIIEEKELKVPTSYGYNTIAGTNEEDGRQVSHWWIEIGNLIIDLTVEQFNRFLDEEQEKYLPIEVISKNTSKARRYCGKERYPDGRIMEEDYDEEENIDWENDEDEWQPRNE